NAKRCKTLEDLLKNSEIVTVHVDGRPQNKHLISSKQFAQMRDGVIFLNLSRGNVVDLEALAAACKSAKVAGAAVDVFPREPASNDQGFDSPLKGLPNVILTPHVGGSTLEAQRNIAEFVSERLISYIKSGSTHLSVNFPQLQLPELIDAHRFLHVHENVPGILAKINGLLAERGINILGQYLKTSEQIGYVITDVDSKYERDVIKELEAINHTIRFRALY
ncbi:MAG: phosphoglycerate dehydrogenase, partial [Proteobacteria bacterium]